MRRNVILTTPLPIVGMKEYIAVDKKKEKGMKRKMNWQIEEKWL